MAYMIQPYVTGKRPLADYQRELRARHTAWATAAVSALTNAAAYGTDGWGSATKRLQVSPDVKGPGEADAQPLGEVINQCATVERLLDAMTWIDQQAGTDRAMVLLCHPTASSAKADPKGATTQPVELPDHDLVIDLNGQQWRFEVSDVANGERDGNGKEAKDLASLGCAIDSGFPNDGARRFLVVSQEFGSLLARKHAKRRTRSGSGRNGKAPPGWQYRLNGCNRTYIVEIRAMGPTSELVEFAESAEQLALLD